VCHDEKSLKSIALDQWFSKWAELPPSAILRRKGKNKTKVQ